MMCSRLFGLRTRLSDEMRFPAEERIQAARFRNPLQMSSSRVMFRHAASFSDDGCNGRIVLGLIASFSLQDHAA